MKAARAKAVDREGPVHRAVYDYLRAALPHAWIVQHTPNKPRSQMQGAREKRMGAVAGWPDLAVYGRMFSDAEPDGLPFACFFEVKPPGKTAEPHQRDVHDALLDIGFRTAVVRSIDDVRRWAWNWNLPVSDATLERDMTGRPA